MKVFPGTPGRPTKSPVSEDTLSRILEVLVVVILWLFTVFSLWLVWNLAVVGTVTVARPLSFWDALLWMVLPFEVRGVLGLVTALVNDWSKNG